MKTIAKDSIAHQIRQELGFSKSFSEYFVSAMFAEMASIIKTEKKINIPNLGSFEIHQKKSRPGRDIKRGTIINIPARKTVRFIPSRVFKGKLNG